MAQIFLSHTRMDKDFCDYFDSICARVGIRAFRSEFETIVAPAWFTITSAVRTSTALFLLIGQELAAKQASHGLEWEYTQNWIAFEIGLAAQLGIPVWICVDEGVTINFSVPYATDYIIGERESNRPYLRDVLTYYNQILRFSHPGQNYVVRCPYDNCQLDFRFHNAMSAGSIVACPQCLGQIEFEKGWPPV